jgi:hypothetical protein
MGMLLTGSRFAVVEVELKLMAWFGWVGDRCWGGGVEGELD